MMVERPPNAIACVNDLKIGDEIYLAIYDIRTIDGPYIVAGDVCQFSETDVYKEYHTGASGSFLILPYCKSGAHSFMFLYDINLEGNRSFNDNIINKNFAFRTKEDAENYLFIEYSIRYITGV